MTSAEPHSRSFKVLVHLGVLWILPLPAFRYAYLMEGHLQWLWPPMAIAAPAVAALMYLRSSTVSAYSVVVFVTIIASAAPWMRGSVPPLLASVAIASFVFGLVKTHPAITVVIVILGVTYGALMLGPAGFLVGLALLIGRWVKHQADAFSEWVQSPFDPRGTTMPKLLMSLIVVGGFLAYDFGLLLYDVHVADPSAFEDVGGQPSLGHFVIFALMNLAQGSGYSLQPITLPARAATAACMATGLVLTVVYLGRGISVLTQPKS